MPSCERPFPNDPILCRLWRGGAIESVHRGAFCVLNGSAEVLDRAGDVGHPFYARSSIKSLQALPLLESGAADRFGFTSEEIALAIASHSGEAIHTERVAHLLARLGLGEEDLRCGPQMPNDPATRRALLRAGKKGGALHNNCSGKHTGFLALALHLGASPRRYLEADGPGQTLVRAAVAEMGGVDVEDLLPGIDGCSAPNYRLPLKALARAFLSMTNPEHLAPKRRKACERITRAAAAHPELVGGNHKRIDTDLMRASGGRLFAKIGAEGVYAVGLRGGEKALALKIDDGGSRALHAVLPVLLERAGLLDGRTRAGLGDWMDARVFNKAGLEVGRLEVVLP